MDDPTPSILGLVVAVGPTGTVIETSRVILPFRLLPVIWQVYLVSIKFRAGKETVGVVDLQIAQGAVQTTSTFEVFGLQLPASQVRVPDPIEIEGSETIEGIARFRTSAER